MHIRKKGDPYLRTLLVQGARLKLAERDGRNGKKRAIIATARKLAVLLHHLWVSAEIYEPLRNTIPMTIPTAA